MTAGSIILLLISYARRSLEGWSHGLFRLTALCAFAPLVFALTLSALLGFGTESDGEPDSSTEARQDDQDQQDR
jgi:hypothetical protein